MGHELTIMIQQSEIRGIRGSQATDYRITYAVPFGVPDPRTKNAILSINGRVYDAETGISIEGVLFFLGDTVTVSGKDGVFKIPRPRFGIEYLRMDQRSIGFGRVPYMDMPIRIDANTDTGFLIEIPVVRSSTFSGTVSLWSRPGGTGLLGRQNEPLEKVAPIRGVLLELKSNRNLYRVKSDRAGIFSFRNIQAGTYQVRYLSGAFPPNHSFESDSTTLVLGPGDHIEQHLRVVPTKRTIRMLESTDFGISQHTNSVQTDRISPTSEKNVPEKSESAAGGKESGSNSTKRKSAHSQERRTSATSLPLRRSPSK